MTTVNLPANGGATLRRAHRRFHRIDWRGVAAFTLPLALYVRTLAPGVYNLDSAELSTAAATGGIVRATGYPLYLLIGRVWTALPVGSPAYLMNLLSALCGALTIVCAERLLRRLAVGLWPAFVALALLACSLHFWALSLIAEVYTLHTALMAALLLALLRWAARPTAARFGLCGLLFGLGLSHHAATVLMAPGCLWFVLATCWRRALAPRPLASLLGGGLAGLSLYLYLPLLASVQPVFNHAGMYDVAGVFHPVDLSRPGGLWWLVSGRQFAGQMLAYSAAEWLGETERFVVTLWRTFFAVGLVPGVVGAWLLVRRDRRIGGALLLMFGLHVVFYTGYRVADKETMFLPAYLIWAVWMAVGLHRLFVWARTQPRLAALLHVGAVCAIAVSLGVNGPLANQSNETEVRDIAMARLAALPEGALVFGGWDSIPAMQYLQLVEGMRPDARLINRFFVATPDMWRWIGDEATWRPVYTDSTTHLPAGWRATADAGLYRITPAIRDHPWESALRELSPATKENLK